MSRALHERVIGGAELGEARQQPRALRGVGVGVTIGMQVKRQAAEGSDDRGPIGSGF